MEIIGNTFADIYDMARLKLLAYGHLISPRGYETREINNVQIVLNNPRSRLGYHKERNFSLPLAVAESISLFSNSDSVLPIAYINKRFLQFSDDGKTLNGHYGSRISGDLYSLIDKLNDDHDTRQAVLSIYVSEDMLVETKDVPCTLSLHFMIRDNALDLHVTMRSNDLFWGLPYDIFQFTVLQEVIANELGIELGRYYHHTNSLHYYTQDKFADPQLIHKVKFIDPIEFKADYLIEDMNLLELQLKYLSEGHVLNGTYLPIDNTGFTEILKRFEIKKRCLEMPPLSSTLSWAAPFYKENKNAK